MCVVLFFFKQKTAYEMCISDLEFRRVLFRSTVIQNDGSAATGFLLNPATVLFCAPVTPPDSSSKTAGALDGQDQGCEACRRTRRRRDDAHHLAVDRKSVV